MTLEVTLLFVEKNVLFVKVPKTRTIHLLQPLYLSVNVWVKQWMSHQFEDWYSEQIQG